MVLLLLQARTQHTCNTYIPTVGKREETGRGNTDNVAGIICRACEVDISFFCFHISLIPALV